MKGLKIIAFALLSLALVSISSGLQAQCSVSTMSNCNTTYTRTIPTTSSWGPSSMSGCSTSKTTRGEGAYTFTPTLSGNYNIFVASVSGTTSSPDFNVYFRQGTCSSSTSGWTCVGSRTSGSTSSPAGTEFLVAGQQYTFMMDWRQNTSPSSSITVGLRVSCVAAPPDPCDNTITMSYCGSTYTRTLSMNSSWNGSTSGCASFGTTRGENTWRFTPQFSGNYPIYLASISGSTTSSSYFNVYYRSGSCSNSTSGWTCIDYRTSASTSTPVGTVFLQAGTQYQFLVDWRRSTAPTADATVGLRVGCYTPPNPCSSTPPTLSLCTGTTTTRSFGGNSGSSSYQSFCSGYGYGEEYIYRFTTQGAGNYQINVTSVSGSGSREVAYKLKQGTICSSSGWACLGSRTTSGTINMNNLAANTTYQLMLDAEERAGDAFSHTFRIECPPCSDIQSIVCGSSYSANLPVGSGAGWDVTDCNFQSTPGTEKMYLIYPTTSGTYDFNVTNANGSIRYFYKQASLGCDANNWNCIGTASAPTIFTVSLTANVPYYILADGVSSTQSASQNFTLECLDPCQGYPSIISCGIPVTANMSASTGAGWMNACGPHTGAGKERIFEYTPQISGPYSIQVNQSTGPMTYYYKPLSQGCGNSGWTCIDAMPTIGTSQTISFTAGTTYLILVDAENPAISARQEFEISCAPHNPCLIAPDTLYCGQVASKLFPNGNGAGWNLQGCSGQGLGKEYLFQYTPIQSGTYDVEVVAMNTVRNSFFIRQYSSTCDTAGFVCVGTVNAPGTVGTVSMQAGTTYTLAVVNDSITFGTVDFRIQGNTLQSVSGLSVNAPACTDIKLGWVADTFAADFELEAATDSLFTQIVHQFTGYSMGQTDTFVVGGLLPATQYYFRVRPIYPCGTGTYSAFVTGTTAGTLVNLVGLNNGPLCEGVSPTLSLSATSNFPGPYEWVHPNYQVTAQNANLNPVFLNYAGVWTVSVFTANCGWISDTTHVTVIPNPASIQLGSNSPVCQFGTLNLTADSRSGVSYAWSGPNGFTSNLQNPSRPNFTVQDTGVYSLTATQSGCGSAVLTTHVSIVGSPVLTLSSNSPVCAGGTTALQLSAGNIPGAGYYWAGPGGFTSTQQNLSISNPSVTNSGVYTLVVTDVCSNLYSDTLSFWVDPGIVNPQVSSNSPACIGGSLSLSSSTHAGVTYFWEGPGGYTSGQQNPVISNVQSGNGGIYTLTLTSSGCPSATLTETVSIQSSLSISVGNNGPFCSGGTSALNLTVGTISGGVYSWTGPNGFTSSQQNPTISNVTTSESGNYYLTVANTCGTATDSTLVVVNSPATNVSALSNTPICTGSQLSLSASAHIGATYNWAGPGGYTSTGQFPVRTGMTTNESGVYTLTVTVPVCGAVSTTRSITVLSSPTATASSNSPVCSGGVVSLNTGTVTGSTYSWAGPNGYTSSQQNPMISNVTISESGNYYLTVANTCGTASDSALVVVNSPATNVSALSNTPICTGSQLSLSASAHTGATYYWEGPGGYTSTGQFPVRSGMTTNESGVYTLTVTVPACGAVSTTRSITVLSSPTASASSNSPVCSGGVIYLNAAPVIGSTYSWAGPNGYTSSLQNPSIPQSSIAQTGDYTLTISSVGCGSSVAVASVLVGPQISSLLASSPSPICQGNSLILNSTAFTGATYFWSGPLGFTSSRAIDTITNAGSGNSGVYSLIVSSPGCGSLTRSVSVSVNAVPVPNAGSNSPVCTGNVIQFSCNPSSGASYSWSGPNGYLSSSSSPAISNSQIIHSGDYTLTLTVPNCGSYTSVASVIVSGNTSSVTAGSNSPVCVGQNLQLSASSLSQATYSWSGPNGFTSSLQNPVISNAQSIQTGAYTLIASSPGCNSTTRIITVNVLNAQSAAPGSNAPLCLGSNLTLTANTVPSASYAWSGPNGFSSTLQNPVISSVQTIHAGTYTLTINSLACGTASATTSVSVSSGLTNVTATGNSPVCAGGSINLTGSTHSGASYSWTGPNGFTSSSQSPVLAAVTTAAAGNYIMVVSIPGCSSVSRTVTVVVNAGPSFTPGNNGPLCSGGALNLTTNGVSGASYLWSGPNGYNSTTQNPSIINVQPAQSGDYTLTVTLTGCAPVQQTTNVTVSANPSNATANANTPICVGSNLQLSATVYAGAVYSWTGPNGFTSNQAQPVINGITTLGAGNYQVLITSGVCPSVTRSRSVVVNPAPVVVPGSNSPVCQGNAIFLTTPAASGVTYAWSGPNSFVSAVQNPSISNAQPIRTGIYTLIVSSTNCGVFSGTTSVVVGLSVNNVVISSNSPACAGGNLNLTGTLNTTATYSWSGPNGFTANTQITSINTTTTASAGIYTLVAVSPGCGTKTITQNVRVNDPATVNASCTPSTVCVGSAVYFNGNAPSGSTFSWTGPVGFASTSQNPSRSNIQLSHGGVYTLSSTVPGCGLVQAFTTLTVNPCRVTTVNNEVPVDQLDVYPNPFSEFLIVKSADKEISKAELLDINGKVIRILEINSTSAEQKLFMGDLPSGTYLLRIYSDENVFLRKVMKQ
jgi:rRNA maturation protein Nop10